MRLTEAITAALGNELSKLNGQRSTRLTIPFHPDISLTSDLGPRGATLVGTTLTLVDRDDLDGDVVDFTMWIRITAGDHVGETAQITAHSISGSDLALTVGATFTSNFSQQPWEVYTPAETSPSVETVFGWPTVGECVIDGVRYRYNGTDLGDPSVPYDASLFNLEGWDGTAWVAGARQLHAAGAEVLDRSKTFSAVDQTWRRLFVGTAAGEALSIVGRNLNVPRPPPLADDTIYAKMIAAAAASPRGTSIAIKWLLNAVLGEGTFEMFRDGTGVYDTDETHALESATRAQRSQHLGQRVLAASRNYATWFLRRRGTLGVPTGRSFLPSFARSFDFRDVYGEEATIPDDLSTFEVDYYLGHGFSVRLATERPSRLVAAYDPLDSGTLIYSTGVQVFAATVGAFGSNVKAGDVLEIINGRHAGARGIILTPDVTAPQIASAGTQLLGCPGYLLPSFDRPAQWRVIRPVGDYRRYLPTADTALIETDPPADVTAWTLQLGSAALALTAGSYTTITGHAVTPSVLSHTASLIKGTRVVFNAQIAWSGTLGSGVADAEQACLVIDEGTGGKQIIVGAIGGTPVTFGFCSATGVQLGTWAGSVALNTFVDIRIEVQPRAEPAADPIVSLYADGRFVQSVAYSSFSATGAAAAIPPNTLNFACLNTTLTAAAMRIARVSWRCETDQDFSSRRIAACDTLVNTAIIQAPAPVTGPDDVGRRVWLYTSTTGVVAGNQRGEYLITDWGTGTGQLTVTGVTQRGATFVEGRHKRLVLRRLNEAVRWPDKIGSKIEILEGPNAGIRTISKILDPVTLEDLSVKYASALNAVVGGAFAGAPSFTIDSNVIEVDSDWLHPSDDGEYTWRFVPYFLAQSDALVEIGGCTSSNPGSSSTVFMGAALPAVALVTGVTLGYDDITSMHIVDDETLANDYSALDVTLRYPFYLWDAWGWARDVLDGFIAAGLQLDLDRLIRTTAAGDPRSDDGAEPDSVQGLHILDE